MGGILRQWAPSLQLMDHPDSDRKRHKHPVPLVGGLAIWIGVTIAYLLIPKPFPWSLWIAMTGMGFVGLADDLFELPVFPKLTLQILVALFLWIFGTRVTLFIPFPLASLLLTLLWFVWVVNALNYMDNIDGLCAGTGAITLTGLTLFLANTGDLDTRLLTTHALTVIGALCGFLPWNFSKHRIFLGDCGSHLIGGALAFFLMQTTFTHVSRGESPCSIFVALFFVFVPLVDFVQVTFDRWRRGQPIWRGDARHLSHRLIAWGLPPSLAVFALWTATAVAITVGLLLWRHLV